MPITQEKVSVRDQAVGELMHPGCVTISGDATLSEAIRKMKNAAWRLRILTPGRAGFGK